MGRGLRGSGVDVCPDAFTGYYSASSITYFVAYCLFFVIALGTLIAIPTAKKRNTNAKRLPRLVYLVSLLFALLAYAMLIIATVLQECGTIEWYTYYIWAIPITIFSRLANFLLLALVVFSVDNLVRQHHGQNPSYYKFIYGFILVVVGALTCSIIGIQSWIFWVYSHRVYFRSMLSHVQARLELSCCVLYILGILAAGAIATTTILSMRSGGTLRSSLIGWTIALIISMFLWALFSLVESASFLTQSVLGVTTHEAFYYLECIFQAISWIILLLIAKSNVLAAPVAGALPRLHNSQTAMYNPPMSQKSQSTYAPYPAPSQGQYQQQQQQYSPYTFHTGVPPPS